MELLNYGNKQNSDKEIVSAVENNKDTSKPEEKEVKYKSYEKLPKVAQIVADFDIYLSVPSWSTENFGYGFTTTESTSYGIIVSCKHYTQPGVSIEEAFSETYNDDFHSILTQFCRGQYHEYTPKIIEKTTLTCGVNAIKFEGKQPVKAYGTETEYYVYGYSFVFKDVPVIVGYVIEDESKVDDAKRAELKDYVDKMVQTVRTKKS